MAQAADEAIRRIHEARNMKSTTGWVLRLVGGGKKSFQKIKKAPPQDVSNEGPEDMDGLSFWRRHPMGEIFRRDVVGRIAQEDRAAMSAAEAD